MLRIGFEPTIPVFERTKIFRAADIDCVTLHTFRYDIAVFVFCIGIALRNQRVLVECSIRVVMHYARVQTGERLIVDILSAA
jgi:hypothetical protein